MEKNDFQAFLFWAMKFKTCYFDGWNFDMQTSFLKFKTSYSAARNSGFLFDAVYTITTLNRSRDPKSVDMLHFEIFRGYY